MEIILVAILALVLLSACDAHRWPQRVPARRRTAQTRSVCRAAVAPMWRPKPAMRQALQTATPAGARWWWQ